MSTLGRAEHEKLIVSSYDAMMYDPFYLAYLGGSQFSNYGYWNPDTPDQRTACENLMERLLGFLPGREGAILDIACGKGGTTAYLLKYYRADHVTGINISSKQLDTCRETAPGCSFLRMSATELTFADRSFDAVICVEAAFHFDTRARFLSEAHRVLRPSGHLILADMLMTPEGLRVPANHVRTPAEYGRALASAGFDDVRVDDVTDPCWISFCRRLIASLHDAYLARRISLQQLKAYLEKQVYSQVPVVLYYVVAAGKKPDRP